LADFSASFLALASALAFSRSALCFSSPAFRSASVASLIFFRRSCWALMFSTRFFRLASVFSQMA
jgi:hypothetical protein